MAEPIFDHDRLDVDQMKQVLKRIVSMLTRLVDRCDVAREDSLEYNADGDYEYEYRDAEYEYEIRTETALWQPNCHGGNGVFCALGEQQRADGTEKSDSPKSDSPSSAATRGPNNPRMQYPG